MTAALSRRELLATTGLACGTVLAGGLSQSVPAAGPARSKDKPFGYCLNTSTIRGQELGIVREVEIAAEAGYDAVEPWMRTLDAYVKGGRSLKDLGNRVRDLGLSVESAIGFAQWIVDDDVVDDQPVRQVSDNRPTVEQAMLYQARLGEVKKAIQTLPEKQRAAVLMHKYEEMEYSQIARALNCSESAVKSLLFRAYETLRVELAPLVALQAKH